jgi:hypothetical protein
MATLIEVGPLMERVERERADGPEQATLSGALGVPVAQHLVELNICLVFLVDK